jgi:hypothetical protein
VNGAWVCARLRKHRFSIPAQAGRSTGRRLGHAMARRSSPEVLGIGPLKAELVRLL